MNPSSGGNIFSCCKAHQRVCRRYNWQSLTAAPWIVHRLSRVKKLIYGMYALASHRSAFTRAYQWLFLQRERDHCSQLTATDMLLVKAELCEAKAYIPLNQFLTLTHRCTSGWLPSRIAVISPANPLVALQQLIVSQMKAVMKAM